MFCHTVSEFHEVTSLCSKVTMSQNSAKPKHKYRHIFLDAEGTLYVPKHGRSRWVFWENPSAEAAVDFFELDKGVRQALEQLRGEVDTVCLVSRNSELILNALLDKFGIRDYFDEIMVNGHKGKKILEYLQKNGFRRDESIMIGDMPSLDIIPVRDCGIEAILVDRPYNRSVVSERITGVRDLPAWLRLADIADRPARPRLATLDEFFGAVAQFAHDAENGTTKSLIAVART
ncbi:MAG: hypothetical protein A3K76_00855 [Euryarchaeota archaeon RBG_13_57_23]|nr:MAG: hypothetical protein A3K76_00855 [Euryarchaeota archaeon RBG_13_57_23]